MSLAELKQQVAVLPESDKAELSVYLATMLRRDDPAYREELSRRIDDCDPSHWVPWSELLSSRLDISQKQQRAIPLGFQTCSRHWRPRFLRRLDSSRWR